MAKKDLETPTCSITRVKIDDFLNSDVKDFARYCIENRACPRLSDGQRTGARKIIYAALTGDAKKKKKVKMMALVGDTLKLEYLHGDQSLANTIVQLGSEHLNRYKPLQIYGQYGYIRQTSVHVAPRYLMVGKSDYISMFETDKELWKIKHEDGVDIEPETFYPIVPFVIMYRTNSPGFGFSFKSFSYSLDSIIMNCIHSIFDSTCTDKIFPLKPDVEGYDNNNFIYNSSKDRWYSLGDFDIDFENDILTITNLPYNIQFEQYEEHLQGLQEKLTIRSFANLSTGDNVRYVIRFRSHDLKMLYRDKWKFFQLFRLYSKVPSDILNVINEYNNIVHYDDAYEFIDAFVKFRLGIYEKRKIHTIHVLKEEIAQLEETIRFIQLVIDGTIVINRRPVVDIKNDMARHRLDPKLLQIAISKFTQDEILALEKKIKERKDYLDYITRTTIEEMYLKELVELREKYVAPTIQK